MESTTTSTAQPQTSVGSRCDQVVLRAGSVADLYAAGTGGFRPTATIEPAIGRPGAFDEALGPSLAIYIAVRYVAAVDLAARARSSTLVVLGVAETMQVKATSGPVETPDGAHLGDA